ncbi:MAG TPA: coniferyl aldehyde dehydrogenase [Burkholderiaceae bacterium]|nr:coniferyl aldehyde dehydrogenase [Burkholderiaceae bacterium]HQR71538.1 coniferyl aldehyde dehydrogenase [Burkholderiaceae bacterium]
MTPSEIPTALLAAFELQRASYDAAPFPEWNIRRDRLQRLQAVIQDNEEAIEAAIDSDFGGRPRMETQIAEVFPSLAELRGAARRGARWMKPRGAWVSKWFLPARAHVMPRPLGVVGIIVPWNYPLFMAVGPLAGAIAAGNRAMVKMSEFTPSFSRLFANLVAGQFKEDELTVVTGGADVAAQFSALPFDHLLFTGSTVVGRHVMTAAAQNLTPVTLELGGKSPTVVAPGYSIERAAQRILAGKLLNAGQTCIAPDYVLLPKGKVPEFVAALRAQAQRMYPRGIQDPDYCSVVNPRHYGRLIGYLDQAAAAGVEVQPLFDGTDRNDETHRLAPMAIVEPPMSLEVMQQEIFGPLLPVIGYEDPEQAIAFINRQPRPLALYWFDDDAARIERALRQTHAGGVCVNETLMHVAQEELPFGGVGPSGMGHYHGRWGFDTFSKLTPVFKQSRLNGMNLFMPPYRPHVAKILRLMKRF